MLQRLTKQEAELGCSGTPVPPDAGRRVGPRTASVGLQQGTPPAEDQRKDFFKEKSQLTHKNMDAVDVRSCFINIQLTAETRQVDLWWTPYRSQPFQVSLVCMDVQTERDRQYRRQGPVDPTC